LVVLKIPLGKTGPKAGFSPASKAAFSKSDILKKPGYSCFP
jgi:hypothetical protein